MNHKQSEEKMPLLRIENLKKYYPIKGGIITHTTGYVKAVDGVSFQICQGETLGLVGESGCGKSTIGRQLVGLEKPTDGTVYYKDHDLGRMNRKDVKPFRTKLQMVFQDPYSSLNPRKHIYEILAQPMLYHGISTKASVEKDILNLLDMVGLPRSVLGRYPHEFSGGQRQRIGIAKALSMNPEFIVCDEPVSALDVSIQAQILNLLRSLQKELGLTLSIMSATGSQSCILVRSWKWERLRRFSIIRYIPIRELFFLQFRYRIRMKGRMEGRSLWERWEAVLNLPRAAGSIQGVPMPQISADRESRRCRKHYQAVDI